MNYKDHFEIGRRYVSTTEVDALFGDPSKATKVFRWKAKNHWKALAKLMVEADLEIVKAKH